MTWDPAVLVLVVGDVGYVAVLVDDVGGDMAVVIVVDVGYGPYSSLSTWVTWPSPSMTTLMTWPSSWLSTWSGDVAVV